MINRHGAGGVDGESIEQFESELELRVQEICARLKAGAYRAPPVRRVDIPKGPGKTGTRPLGIPTVADRLLQKAVARTSVTPAMDIGRGVVLTTHCAHYASRS